MTEPYRFSGIMPALSLTNRPRVLLLDQHKLMLDAVDVLFAGEWNIVGKIHDADALLQAANSVRPDVVLLGIATPSGNSFAVARQLRQQMPAVKIIFLTMFEDPGLVAEAFGLGASGYVLKRSAASELSAAIHAVVGGKQYVTPSLSQAVMQSLVAPQAAVELSTRQQEVLRMLAKGHTMKQIAATLEISARTVAFHKYQMMTQLGIKSSAELIQYAVRQNVI